MQNIDKILDECPFLKEIIEYKIVDGVNKVKIEKDREIDELKETIKDLTEALLIGGNSNVQNTYRVMDRE